MSSPLSFATAALLIGGTCLPASDPQDPVRAIPSSSYAGARFAGLEACTRAAEALPIVRWIEQVAAPGRKQLEEQAKRAWQRADLQLRELGLDRKTLLGVLRRPVAAGVGRLTFFDDEPVPSFALALDVSGHEQQIRACLDRIAAQLVDRRGLELEVRTDSTQQGGAATLTWLHLTHPRHSGNAIAVLGDGLLLLGNSPGYLRECVGAWRGQQESIAQLEIVERGVDRIGAAPILSAVVNPPEIAQLLPYEMTDVLAALGLDGVSGAFYAAGVHEQASRDVLYLATDDRPTGVVQAFLPSPATEAHALSYCAKDTLAYASGEVDGAKLVDSVDRALRALPKDARRELSREVLGELRRELGGIPESLRSIGTTLGETRFQWTLAGTMPGGRSLIPEGLLVVQPTRENAVAAEQLRDALEDVLLDANQTVKRARFRELELRYFQVQDAEIRIAPAFCVHDGRLVVASDIRSLKSALARQIDGRPGLEAGGLLDQKTHAACGIPVSSIVHLRTSLAIRAFWPLAEGALRSLPDDFEGAEFFDFDALPEVDQLLEAVTDIRVGVRRHAKGVDWLGESTIGAGSVLAFLGALLDDLLELPGRPKVG